MLQNNHNIYIYIFISLFDFRYYEWMNKIKKGIFNIGIYIIYCIFHIRIILVIIDIWKATSESINYYIVESINNNKYKGLRSGSKYRKMYTNNNI